MAHHPDPFLSKGSCCKSPPSGAPGSKSKWVVGELQRRAEGAGWGWKRWSWDGYLQLRSLKWENCSLRGRGKEEKQTGMPSGPYSVYCFSCDQERKGEIFISQWDTQYYPLPSEGITHYCERKQRHTCIRYW